MPNNGLPPSSAAAPTRVRYSVLFMLCLLAMITYMDRAANGNARADIMKDVNAVSGTTYTTNDYFWALIAFQLAYALFEVPSGWLGDTSGPRKTLLRVVLWWSLFVFLWGFVGLSVAGIALGFGALIVIQFLFGVGEAGAFPNIAKALYNWFPASQRGFAKSIIWMSARFMGGLTPLVWVVLTDSRMGGLHWRETLWLFSAVAFVWCIVFFFFFRNKPAEHPGVNAAEREYVNVGRVEQKHVVVPWGKLIRSRNLWAICFMYVVTNFCWYFLMYNLPGAMKETFKDWNATIGGTMLLALLAGCPLLIGMFGCLAGGILSDRYIRKTGDRKWGRRIFGMIGYGGAGLSYLAAAGATLYFPGNFFLFALFLILMGFMNDLIMAPAWATCQDIGRDYAATVSGAMNMFGNLVGAVSTILITGLILDANTQVVPADAAAGTKESKVIQPMGYVICFTMYSIVYFLGVGIWLLIDPTKPIEPAESQPTDSTGIEEP